MPKVSVVVPIYGVEQYIERCARSLFEQTLEDMEFVFVDDCTKDNSMAVLEKTMANYPHRREQVKIIHHEINKGLSFARQTGVNNSTGDYIGHCDSDDWVDKEMYEILYNTAVAKQLDFVRCNYRMTNGVKCFSEGRMRLDGGFCDKTKLIGWAISDQGWNSIWCTLVARSVYAQNTIQYTTNAMLEDMYVVIQLMTYSMTIGAEDRVLYNYFYNPQSISKQQDFNAIIKRSKAAYENINWMHSFIEHHYDIKQLKNEVVALKVIPRRDLIPALLDIKNYYYWNGFFCELGIKPVLCRYLPKKLRFQYFLAYFRLYPLFIKVYRKAKSIA